MSQGFPLVGVIAPNYLYRSMIGPALALGIDVRLLGNEIGQIRQKAVGCDFVTVVGDAVPVSTLRTLESEGILARPNSTTLAALHGKFSNFAPGQEGERIVEVLVARSPHSQGCAWTPTDLIFRNGLHRISIAPANGLSDAQSASLQHRALDLIQELEIIGVASVIFQEVDASMQATFVSSGPTFGGNWTSDVSITGQFEQHLRAILDLPLGDPAMTRKMAASGNFLGAGDRNMYRPYLHLMARSPAMKVHQYRDSTAEFSGHVTSSGKNLLDLTEEIWHALDYMDGVIDE